MNSKNSRFRSSFGLDHFRQCANCHTLFAPASPICEKCWDVLRRRLIEQGPVEIDLNFGKLYSLWMWPTEGDDVLAKLIYSLKGGGFSHCHDRLARLIQIYSNIGRNGLEIRSCSSNATRTKAFPVPSSSGRPKHDHGFEFARAVSKSMGWDFCATTLLRSESKLEGSTLRQHWGTKEDRRRSKFQSALNTSSATSSSVPCVMLDDLVTTGHTARATWEAIGSPAKFTIVSISAHPALIEDFPGA